MKMKIHQLSFETNDDIHLVKKRGLSKNLTLIAVPKIILPSKKL